MANLIYNAIKTPDGTVIRSRTRHEMVTHQDANGKRYFVDGGTDYCRRSNNGDEVCLCRYDDEPHDVQRRIVDWGSYGKDGKQPLRLIAIADMETDHIKAVLRECNPSQEIKNCMEQELLFRKEARK